MMGLMQDNEQRRDTRYVAPEPDSDLFRAADALPSNKHDIFAHRVLIFVIAVELFACSFGLFLGFMPLLIGSFGIALLGFAVAATAQSRGLRERVLAVKRSSL